MKAKMKKKDKILVLLRKGDLTVEEIAEKANSTVGSVHAMITYLRREGFDIRPITKYRLFEEE